MIANNANRFRRQLISAQGRCHSFPLFGTDIDHLHALCPILLENRLTDGKGPAESSFPDESGDNSIFENQTGSFCYMHDQAECVRRSGVKKAEDTLYSEYHRPGIAFEGS